MLQCLWVPVLNKIAKQGREKFQQVIDFNFLQRLIKNLLDPDQGFVYEWINKRDDDLEIEKPILEVYRVLALCTQNHDFNQLEQSNKEILMSFYWKMIKLKYNFKQWHIFTISEFFKNVNMVQEKVNEVYYTILESNINENGRGRILQSIAIDNIINSMDLEDVCSIKKAVNYLKQDENMIVHIADILIKYEKKFYENVTTYSNDIKTILMKMLANSYSSNLEKNKIILYLCQVCIKWMNRIIRHHSLPGSTPLERKIEVEYEKAYVKLSDTANICLQKELKVISSNINNCTAELLLKYLILFRDMHRINPLYSVENKIMVEANFTDKDTKEKSK